MHMNCELFALKYVFMVLFVCVCVCVCAVKYLIFAYLLASVSGKRDD